MKVTIRVRLVPRTKNDLKSYGFRKLKGTPIRLRTSFIDDLITYTKEIEFTDKSNMLFKFAQDRKIFVCENTPMIGMRCIGIIDILEYYDELYSYIWI